MRITLLCNAGLAICSGGETLLVDVPAGNVPPFLPMEPEIWQQLLRREGPYERLAGLWFTHTHADHCDPDMLKTFCERWPNVYCGLPRLDKPAGRQDLGPFSLAYCAIPHAPIPNPTLHRVAWIQAGEHAIYIAGDAALDIGRHRTFLGGRRADAAFFNAMYLSCQDTRALLRDAARHVYIYHMPADRNDGIWRKCLKNLDRFSAELETVTVLDHCPTTIIL